MRRVLECMPDLPANRGPRISLGVSGADRIHHQPESFWQRRRISTVRLNAMRRVQGYLPGQDRYSAHPAASALERELRETSAEVAMEHRAGAIRRAQIRPDGAASAHGPNARKARSRAPEAIRTRRLPPLDAAAIRQLDQI